MRLLYGVILAVLVITIFSISLKRTRDLFSPLCVFSMFQFIRYVPNMVLKNSEWSYILHEGNLFIMLVIETLFVICVYIGYEHRSRGRDRISLKKSEYGYNNDTAKTSYFQIFFVYMIGISAKIYKIYKSGGILYIMDNTSTAYLGLTTGNGYITSMMYFVFISYLMMLEKIRRTKKKVDIIILFMMVILYSASDLIYSHRSTTLVIIIILLFGYNYIFKKFTLRDFLKPELIILQLIVIIILAVMPIIRGSSFSNISSNSLGLSFASALESIVDRLSMVGRDTFVYNYFNFDNFWLGKSYLNIILAPIPSSIWTGKPAVDDGFYLIHLLYGIAIEPNASVGSMYFNYSIPFTSQGLLYANFGLLGIILGGFLTGKIYANFYLKMLENKNIYNIAIYRVVITDFAFTVGMLTPVLMQYICIKIICYLNKRKYKKGNYLDGKKQKSALYTDFKRIRGGGETIN